jgi:hypothetical protein
MPKVNLYLNTDALARARFELQCIAGGDPVSCAYLRHDDKTFLVIRVGHQLYLMDENNEFYLAETDDVGLIAFQEPEPELNGSPRIAVERQKLNGHPRTTVQRAAPS